MSENKKDGGPAFPITLNEDVYSGMSLRDYFAAKAMQGITSNFSNIEVMDAHIKTSLENGMTPVEMVAAASYDLADAMFKERNK